MNIHKELKANKIKTFLIILLFPLVLGVLFYASLWALFSFVQPANSSVPVYSHVNYWASLVLPIVAVISILWMLISYYKGGDMMMRAAGAVEIKRKDSPEIYSLVENIAATAGTPTPRVFIMNTQTLNAFATGRDPEHSAIALTIGIINKLNRPELEAVIAHEMGHIVNRDIRLTMLVSTGIGVLTLLGQILIRVRARGKNGQAALVMNIAGLVFLFYGAFLAPIIMLALSRRREFQADATSAYLTRNPLALASALEKISGRSEVEALKDNTLVSAACIEKAVSPKKFLSGLFSTHPPIEERVKVLRGN